MIIKGKSVNPLCRNTLRETIKSYKKVNLQLRTRRPGVRIPQGVPGNPLISLKSAGFLYFSGSFIFCPVISPTNGPVLRLKRPEESDDSGVSVRSFNSMERPLLRSCFEGGLLWSVMRPQVPQHCADVSVNADGAAPKRLRCQGLSGVDAGIDCLPALQRQMPEWIFDDRGGVMFIAHHF